ncbi:hypothetical protein AB6A40_001533 [Gnathostoma spinigerum]|uniref:Uncharacterized protein n=1 Tax=Gnathostoma spinigerum TaxID=75299 RepID=A0ABD6EBV1_9BILA
MEDHIEERLCALEACLGIGTPAEDAEKSFDVGSMKKKIDDLGYGFILNFPSEEVNKLYNFQKESERLSFSDKLRVIDYGYDLTMERARLLESFQKASEIVMNSEAFESVTEYQSQIRIAENELVKALEEVQKYCVKVAETKKGISYLLRQLQARLRSCEKAVARLESCVKTEG